MLKNWSDWKGWNQPPRVFGLLVCASLSCITLLFAAPPSFAKKSIKTTVVDMISTEYGDVKVYASPDMVTILFKGGGEIHASAPTWKVVCSNPNDRTIIEIPWEEWKKVGIPSLVNLKRDHFLSPKTRLSKAIFMGKPAIAISAPYSQHAASAILPTRSSSRDIKGLGPYRSPDFISMVGMNLNIGTRATELVQYLYKSPPEIGFPLRIVVSYHGGSGGMSLDTRSITTVEKPETFFLYPRGYQNKVRTPEVALAGRQIETMFQGLLDDNLK